MGLLDPFQMPELHGWSDHHLRPGMILQVAGGEIIWEFPEIGGLGLGRSFQSFS